MYINITDSETGNNKGSCGSLVAYLEKENRMVLKESESPGLWFTTNNRDISPQEVRVKIDHNVAKLGCDDAKFFLINISPSEKEITFLKQQFGHQGAEEQLKKYATGIMDAYAQNFKRENIKSGADLLWYGKLEHFRYYNYSDDEVKQGIEQAGNPKKGEQMHIQIIVSRKDLTNRIKLSPMNNSRGSNEKHSAKLGQFNRLAFKESGELLFDEMYAYKRRLKETVDYSLLMKNGNAEQKRTVYVLDQIEKKLSGSEKESFIEIAKKILKNNDFELEQLLNTFDFSTAGLFNIFSTDPLIYDNAETPIPDFKKKKGKRRGW